MSRQWWNSSALICAIAGGATGWDGEYAWAVSSLALAALFLWMGWKTRDKARWP